VRDLLFHRVGGSEEVLLRVDHMVLGPGDAAEGYARLELLVVDAEAFERGLYDGLLIGFVVDGESAREADVADAKCFDVSAKHADAEAVEGGERGLRERGVAEDFFYTLGHLFCGFISEGDREDIVGANASLLNEISDAMGDDARFAGAGAGKEEDRAIDREDALALLRVHVGEEVRHKVHFICL